MIKFSAGFIQEREAHLIGLGLTDDNLNMMLRGQKPIHVKSEELGLGGPGFDLGIIAAMSFEGIQRIVIEAVKEKMGGEEPKEKVSIPCMNMADKFWLFPFMGVNDRGIYIVGFTQDRFDMLRHGQFPTFRVRSPEKGFTPLEVLMFWGPSVEIMEEQFAASGLVPPGGSVRKL